MLGQLDRLPRLSHYNGPTAAWRCVLARQQRPFRLGSERAPEVVTDLGAGEIGQRAPGGRDRRPSGQQVLDVGRLLQRVAALELDRLSRFAIVPCAMRPIAVPLRCVNVSPSRSMLRKRPDAVIASASCSNADQSRIGMAASLRSGSTDQPRQDRLVSESVGDLAQAVAAEGEQLSPSQNRMGDRR